MTLEPLRGHRWRSKHRLPEQSALQHLSATAHHFVMCEMQGPDMSRILAPEGQQFLKLCHQLTIGSCCRGIQGAVDNMHLKHAMDLMLPML